MSRASTGARAGTGAGRPARVAIVDDHPIATESLAARFVAAGFTVQAPVCSVEDFDAEDGADIVVCDLHLPGTSGAHAIAHLVALGAQVLASSGVATPDEVLDAVAAGARGYVEKIAPPHTFVEAVTGVVGGGFHVSARLAGYLLADHELRPLAREEIGRRELDLLRALAQGDLAAEFAAERHLAAGEVDGRLARVFDAARRRRRLHRPSPREAEVMVLLGCRGLSHKEAAREMNVRPSVISDYLKTVKSKYLATHPDAATNVAPTTAALLWARELGFC